MSGYMNTDALMDRIVQQGIELDYQKKQAAEFRKVLEGIVMFPDTKSYLKEKYPGLVN